MPRLSEANIEKNTAEVDKFVNLGAKYNATAAQIILAWMLAEHPDCMSSANYVLIPV